MLRPDCASLCAPSALQGTPTRSIQDLRGDLVQLGDVSRADPLPGAPVKLAPKAKSVAQYV